MRVTGATGHHHPRGRRPRRPDVVLAEYINTADMPETTKLMRTLDRRWDPIEPFVTTRVTIARSEAANLTCKNLKRIAASGTRPTTKGAS